jgi:outer membrane receptor for ferrienterochelin and colicin
LYKGGIPARYGGRISSVLDISAKEGNRKDFTGNAGISPVTTHLTIEGPLIEDTLTFMITGRTTYSDWLLRKLDNPALNNSKASFYDLNAKLTYDPDKKNKFDLSAYLSNDSFSLNSDTAYNYNNSIIALKWRHFYNSRFLSVMTLNNSNYNYDISGKSETTEGFILSHNINSTGFKADFSWFAGRHEFNFGTDLTAYSVLPGEYLPSNDSSLVTPGIIPKENALETGLYFDDKFSLTDYLSVNAGIRLSSFFTFGPDTILIYDPEFPKSPSTVTDTMYVSSNHINRNYAGPEIRLSLNFRLSPESSLKINYNRTRQYLHMLSNSTAISPTDTWKLCDYYLKPQSGIQYSMGYYRLLPKGIDASAEVYYKDIKNMVDYKGGTKLVMNGTVEKDLINVKGKAYGVELMVKKTEGRIRWSFAYTYSRTLVKSTGTFSDEIINSGNWFPASFDKPNDLTTTFSYVFSRRLSISGNYTWSTGRPITYPVATYHLQDLILIHYSDRNKYRLPDYSRLDLSVRINGSLKTRRIGHPNWTISVYNVLGRENVYSVYFKNDNNTITGYKLSIFAQAIPSVTYSFDF